MKGINPLPSLRVILASLGISFFLTAYIYFFFLQSPALGKREVLFAVLIFTALAAGLSFFLSRFLIPSLKKYPGKAKIAWFLLSALIGLIAVWITLAVPFFILSLPVNKVEINLTAGDPGRVVTLQWITTSLGDISFDQLEKDGEWNKTDTGLVNIGSSPAALWWTGRGGDTLKIVFTGAQHAGRITITTNGNSRELDLASPSGKPVEYETVLPVHPINLLLVQFSLWFSVSFLFLALTLFLTHVKLMPQGKTLKLLHSIEQKLKPVVRETNPKPARKWWGARDWLVFSMFFGFTLLFFLGRWNGLTPFIDLDQDAEIVNSYAASLDNPGMFTGDPLFADPSNFGYYVSFQVPLVRLLKTMVGDYGTAYIALLIPFMLLQMTGFYVFGRVLFRGRLFPFLLAILSTFLINTRSWDYWGVFNDPQPRMMFQSLLPWVLALVIVSINKVGLRWLVFACLGIMIYIHPVSIPAIAFAIWFGYLCVKPKDSQWGPHFLKMLGFGLVFLLFTIPFFWKYLGNREITETINLDYQTAISFLKGIFPGTFELRLTQAQMIAGVLQSGLVLAAYVGAVMVYRFSRERERFWMVMAWIAGILIVSIVFNGLEQQIEYRLQILPVLMQLNRGLRYTVPLMEVLALWPLALLWERADEIQGLRIVYKAISVLTGILLLIIFSFRFPATFETPIPDYRFSALRCLATGRLVCPDPKLQDQTDMAEYIRIKTPQGSLFLSIPPLDMGGAIRYEALRPLAFDQKDMLRLSLSNVAGAMALQPYNISWEEITLLPRDEQFVAFLEFAEQRNTDFIVAQNPIPEWLASRILYANNSISLLDLR
jgi:hypothetical protein